MAADQYFDLPPDDAAERTRLQDRLNVEAEESDRRMAALRENAAELMRQLEAVHAELEEIRRRQNSG